jgi:hypothetical protein
MELLISGEDKIVKALERELYFRSRRLKLTVSIISPDIQEHSETVKQESEPKVEIKRNLNHVFANKPQKVISKRGKK